LCSQQNHWLCWDHGLMNPTALNESKLVKTL
jgi:hypothetical protein